MKIIFIKIVALFLFTFLCNCCLAQPGYDYKRGRKEIEILNNKIALYPDSISLHEARFRLLYVGNSFDEALNEINYLLNKKPKSKDYLLQKAHLYQTKNSDKKEEIAQIITYFEDYFKEEKDYFFIQKELVSLGQTLFYKKKYNTALKYYDKALAIKSNIKNNIENNKQAYYRDVDIKNYKIVVFDSLKQYNKALDLIEEIDGKLSIRAIRYNNLNIKNYYLAKKYVIEKLKENDTQNVQNQFNYTSPSGKFENYVGRHILELAYTEYKLKNSEKALEILYNYAVFDFKNLFISTGDVYSPYWCMYKDLYKQYQQKDYRIHVITAYNYTNETHGLTSMKFDNITKCKPAILLNLQFNSHSDFALKLR